MELQQHRWSSASGWGDFGQGMENAHVVLLFADTPYFRTPACYESLRQRFPSACIVGCSSSGSVLGTHLSDDDVAATAVRLDRSRVRLAVRSATEGASVSALAADLVEQLRADDLRHVIVLADGQHINGSELASGFSAHGIPVTGGLAADGARFGTTWVMADGPARPDAVAALGIYGDASVHGGCHAGWLEFGAERRVTRATGNVVHEIDGQPALALYRKYLGGLASELPGSGLRFPLSVRAPDSDTPVIRTLLGIDEPSQSLRFAGDVPQGHRCKLMYARFEDLVDSATRAARAATAPPATTALALVVSCVGRRLVLGQLAEEELDAVQAALGPSATLAGFYSYGELAATDEGAPCQLHNQTMTLTVICE